jgi:ABC-2 type transport system permease protein
MSLRRRRRPRGRVLAALAAGIVVAVALVAGTAAFGWHPLRLPGTGVQLPAGQAVTRMLIVLGYVLVTEVAVAGIAFLLSVSTDSPLGAVGGAVGLMILSAILDQVTALGAWRQILPSHWQFAWLDAVQAQITWGGMLEGVSVCACYGTVLLALAFRRFQRKDIVS